MDDAALQHLAERIDRIESFQEISQLPSRYALAIDSRDIEALTRLFADDVSWGRWGVGSNGARAYFGKALRDFYRSIHQICGQTVDLLDADTARGTTYCRAEHEDGEGWFVMAICYEDTYAHRASGWQFTARKERHWYMNDILQRPDPRRPDDWPAKAHLHATLPQAFGTWSQFWAGARGEDLARRTAAP
jgi:hypothetical protein